MTSGSDWSGPVGDVWAAEWRRTDRSFGQLSRHLDAAILAAAPKREFRALDIGCGAGGTSLALAAARSDAQIVGIDLSPELIAVARSRVANIEAQRLNVAERAHGGNERLVFEIGDASGGTNSHPPFDMLFSRHGVMFFDDPVAAFTALRTQAAPNARLVFSCFRAIAANPWATMLVDAAGGYIEPAPADPPPGPFAFADPDRVRGILSAAGWQDARPTAVDYAYRAGQGPDPVADALDFLRRIGPAARLLRMTDADDRTAMIDRLTAVLAAHQTGDAIDFPAAAWIWSATAQESAA